MGDDHTIQNQISRQKLAERYREHPGSDFSNLGRGTATAGGYDRVGDAYGMGNAITDKLQRMARAST